MKKLLGLLFAFALFVSLGFAQTLRVGTQSIPNAQSLAIASGILEEELNKIGAKLEVISFDTGRDVNNALASKSIDIGYLGTTPYVAGILSGLEHDTIYVSYITKKAEALAVKQNTFQTIHELKGQKIGVPFGTSAHYALLSILSLNGISSNEVELLDLNPNDLFAAWQRGDIQAACVWDITLSTLPDSKIISSDEDLLNTGIYLSDVNAVRRQYEKENPQTLRTYVKALDRAHDLYKNDREKVVKIFAKLFRYSDEEVRTLIDEKKALWLNSEDLEDSKFLGTSAKKGDFSKTLQNIAEFLRDQGVLRKIPKDIDFADYVNPDFL